MVQVKLTLEAPVAEATVNDITTALRNFDSQVRMTLRNQTELNYELLLPAPSDGQYEAVGQLCKNWINEPNPVVLAYSTMLTGP